MRAVQIEEFGGPEVLQVVDVPKPEPGEGELLIEVSRAGMNFADTHQRENSYLARYEVPLILGGEVAGTTEDGRRVVALLPSGGYAEYAVAPEATVYPIPDGLDEGAALALLIQGVTAWHLLRTCGRVAPGESVVVISGAGGVGSLAEQRGEAGADARAGRRRRRRPLRRGPHSRAGRRQRRPTRRRGARDVRGPRLRPERRGA